MRAVRILVDHSGYDLLNIGDVAMLQSCVIRLRRIWPDAEILVISPVPERLALYCPGTIAIGRTYADLPFFRALPRRPRLASEQAWKMAAPYFSGRLRLGRVRPGRPRTAVQAVWAADLVVASGGGYVTDSWWWHAVGVLSVLSLAQRLGKPTAMFGQGVGPIGRRILRVQARAVLPRLAVLGLREDRIGRELALSLGVSPGAVAVTGDDALELIADGSACDTSARDTSARDTSARDTSACDGSAPEGHALGVSMRVSDYAGVDPAAAQAVGDLLVQAAGALQAPIVGLPVSRYPVDGDLGAIRALLRPEHGRADIRLDDLTTPQALVTAAASCRVIVTGSYHAAVFGLAQGVPAICLTKSSYYDAKFAGLSALFPGACFVGSLGQPDFADWLRTAIDRAWHLPAPARAAARDAAAAQRHAGRAAYTQFRDAVEGSPLRAAAGTRHQTWPAAASHRDVPVPGVRAGFSPAQMLEVELTEPLPAVSYDAQHGRAWVLGRLHGEPVGTCEIQLEEDGLTPDQLGALLWPELREPVTARFAAAGMAPPGALTGSGLAAEPAEWPFLRRRAEVLATAPFISVVVCTRDRADQLEACLRHLDRQEYPRFEVVVVDNAPASDAVRALVQARQGPVRYRYAVERRGGLSWARNAGIAAASGEIIAFLDDDEEPDRHWLAGLAGGFGRGDDIGCVTGMILPTRLDTRVQEWFERSGGHSKGRGFASAVFSRHGPQSPLYPLPPFGAGGNMAFRREALSRIGGFDVAMGTGTPACASEDTLALTLVLLAGYRIAYEPAALMRHDHYAGMDGLARQLRGYGVGLAAYYTALLRHRPGVFPALLGQLPAAAAYLRRTRATGAAAPQDLPAGFKGLKRRGMLAGPGAYVRSVRRQARVAASVAASEALQ
jgi:polysaccharide pyruvyl transferase WcaK-like protein/GT2 family glycosyltransferase